MSKPVENKCFKHTHTRGYLSTVSCVCSCRRVYNCALLVSVRIFNLSPSSIFINYHHTLCVCVARTNGVFVWQAVVVCETFGGVFSFPIDAVRFAQCCCWCCCSWLNVLRSRYEPCGVCLSAHICTATTAHNNVSGARF